ncbi:MAG: hypothetical protein H6839_12930 [Planctomycetes bacterium]|nr:hypothetical protein [Planctomycetota bacterium]
MKKLMVFALAFLLVACGSTGGSQQKDAEDDGSYTQDDLKKDTDGVYRPSDPGKDDDGVKKDAREKPRRDDTVENKSDGKKEEPKTDPNKDPKKDPDPKVENPKDDPKKDPKSEPKEEPKKEPDPKVEEPKKDRTPLITSFISRVSSRMDALEGGKLWKDFLKAKEKFDDRVDKGLEKGKDDNGKDAEAAWANAIQAWYEVRYMYELFMHVNWKASKEFAPGAGLNFDDLQQYSDEELQSESCVDTYAAYELAEPEMKEIRQFQTDILKYDRVASKVYTDANQEKKWKDEKQKWLDATNGKFEDKDIKKYSN